MQNVFRPVLVLTVMLWTGLVSAAEPAWTECLRAVDVAQDGVQGRWVKSGDGLTVGSATGARLALPYAPRGEYDLRVSFTRRTGQHSVGVLVPHGGRSVAFELDAWGSHLAGFQDVGGKTIRENASRRENITLQNNRRYTLLIEVRKDQLRALLDGQELSKLATTGIDLSVSNFWTMRDPARVGLLAWESETLFHSAELRLLSGQVPAVTREPLTVARTPATTSPSGKAVANSKTAKSAGTGTRTTNPAPLSPRPTGNGAAKKVVIVIANHHFFYREYSEPRQELERAGVQVTVAAGRKAPCYPHPGTGEGSDRGLVQPDLAISQIKAADFDAILFSGGWGSSAYQFAFPGRYQDQQYNGERAVKTEVNRVINEFLAQDKYVCGLCNAVSVLAWARVNGRSPLQGKRVCAPTRGAAPGVYPGQQGVPSCRWHPEQNGAILSPAGAIGQPGTPVDDVLVDGRIITGEDDPSAREMGRRIVEVLSQ